jgi:adenine-specific DNA methylase
MEKSGEALEEFITNRCSEIIEVNFGEGMKHIKKIICKDKTIINSGYAYDENTETETILLKDALLHKGIIKNNVPFSV